jgi:hypothetical protein
MPSGPPIRYQEGSIRMDDDRKPWERQRREPIAAFSKFNVFREMGPERTLAELARRLGKHPKTMEQQSRRYRWRERAELHDQHLAALSRKAEEKAVQDARARHVQIARLMQGIAGKRLEALFERVRKDPEAAGDISAGEVRLLADMGIRLERLLLGEPETRAESTQTVEARIENRDDRAYASALAKVASALGVKPEDL